MDAIVMASTEGLSREDWLAYRNLGIGGSDASVICGVNKYKSPFELWMEKTGQLPSEEAGEAAYWGMRMEPIIIDEFVLRTGIKILPVKKILQSRSYPFMLANLDGVCRCPTHGKCVFEAKTASVYKADAWDDSVPYEYILQVQHYLCVTGYNGAYVAALIGGNFFTWKFVPRDEELISMLIRMERDFWKHVKDNVPPSLDGSDACANFLRKRYPIGMPHSKIKLPDSAVELISQHGEASKKIEFFTKQKQHATNVLKQMLGENELGILGDSYVKWQTVAQSRFDAGLLEAEQPKIHAQYITKSSHRRFTIKVSTEKPGETSKSKVQAL